MAYERKKNETRSWDTAYRGELAICASKRIPPVEEFVLMGGKAHEYGAMLKITPFGCVVCVVDLCDVVKTEHCVGITDEERSHGDYTRFRFAWITENCKRLLTPVPVIGRQGLFNLPPDVEAKVRAQL